MSVWNGKIKIQKSRKLRLIAVALLVITMAGGTASTQAQVRRQTRRDTTATRKARIQREIEDTYTHRWEIGGGGGYLRWRSGQNLRKDNQVTFWMNGTYFLNQKLGITGDVRGAYGNAYIGNTVFNLPNPQISEYAFLVGPTYRVYAKQKSAVSVYAQGGTSLGKFGGDTKGIPETSLGLWPSSDAKAAFSIGANFDYNLSPNLAMRVSPTYLGTTFGSTLQNNYGLNVGFVYRFGRIR